jgi:hypothetical protein
MPGSLWLWQDSRLLNCLGFLASEGQPLSTGPLDYPHQEIKIIP